MKTIQLLSFALLLSAGAFAQNTASKRTSEPVQFGIKAGVNVAKMVQSGPEPYDTRTSFHVGGLAHIHLSRAFALQPELVYSRQGAKYSLGTDKFDYINLPILAQYMNSGFRVQTGPQVGWMVNGQLESPSGTETEVKNLDNFDLSWAFGVGYLTKSGFGVDARYNLGITDITSDVNNENRNRVWQFGVFYQFKH